MKIKLREGNNFIIPEEVIKVLGLKEGDSVEIELEDGKIVITPIMKVASNQETFLTDK